MSEKISRSHTVGEHAIYSLYRADAEFHRDSQTEGAL